jgi:hypothetical protein
MASGRDSAANLPDRARRSAYRATFPLFPCLPEFFGHPIPAQKSAPLCVAGRRVFHMMMWRFAQIFVVSKALNHLQLSLTIARIC